MSSATSSGGASAIGVAANTSSVPSSDVLGITNDEAASVSNASVVQPLMGHAVMDFEKMIARDRELPMALAAILVSIDYIHISTANTMMELRSDLTKLSEVLSRSVNYSIQVSSGCDLFMRFVTRTALDAADFECCKNQLITRGKMLVQKFKDSRLKIAKLGNPFIRDGTTILTHSLSRVVLRLFIEAAAANKRFSVYVTESRPDCTGSLTALRLKAAGIPVTVIMDSAIGYIMEKVDIVLVGAEGVVENGGIINKVGTYPLSVVAHATNKPFYVLVESFKFIRYFPLSQYDLPNADKQGAVTGVQKPITANGLQMVTQEVDYTPPKYITLLFTDLGVLTPSAVSDQLITLYM